MGYLPTETLITCPKCEMKIASWNSYFQRYICPDIDCGWEGISEGGLYICPTCQNEDHQKDARYCKICGEKIKRGW